MSLSSRGRGFFFAISAFSFWGLLPLYWRLLAAIDSLHILAARIFFSLVLVGIILLTRGDYAWLKVFKEPKKMCFQILTSLVLCFNWGLYIWAVNRGFTFEVSLGYYINPLVSILLGLLFYRERLPRLQWAAVAVALSGVLIITVVSGSLPWISLTLAVSFGVYGLLKKKASLSALGSLGAETLASVPAGILLLCLSYRGAGENALLPVFTGPAGLSYFMDIPAHIWVLFALSGLVSVLPLYGFAQGAKLLPLSALGFTQFISPTFNFILGLFVFGESFPLHYFAAFVCIWIAVIIYIISLRHDSGKTVGSPSC